MKKANYELVRAFLTKENPEAYDFKQEDACLSEIQDPLERELFFKRRGTKAIDPDCCELTMSIMCLLLEMQGMPVCGYEGRHIYLKNGTILETDTANSFISLYKGALMTHVAGYDDLCDKYGITGGFMDAYDDLIYPHRDEFSLTGHHEELMDRFKQFAALTHAIGNFILGPKGFNCADPRSKAKIISAKFWDRFDRIDLFFQKTAEDAAYADWKKWFSENCITTYNDFFYEKVSYGADGKTVDLTKSALYDLGDPDLVKRVDRINQIILLRGKAITKDLRAYLKTV